jgi:hypothetical protein
MRFGLRKCLGLFWPLRQNLHKNESRSHLVYIVIFLNVTVDWFWVDDLIYWTF